MLRYKTGAPNEICRSNKPLRATYNLFTRAQFILIRIFHHVALVRVHDGMYRSMHFPVLQQRSLRHAQTTVNPWLDRLPDQ